jgi:hypothetical protein
MYALATGRSGRSGRQQDNQQKGNLRNDLEKSERWEKTPWKTTETPMPDTSL